MNKTPEEILKEITEIELQLLKDQCHDEGRATTNEDLQDCIHRVTLKAMQEYADQEKRKAFNEALELAKTTCPFPEGTTGRIISDQKFDKLKIK